MLTPRERTARAERHEERAQLGRIRASTESYPARALSLDDLDVEAFRRIARGALAYRTLLIVPYAVAPAVAGVLYGIKPAVTALVVAAAVMAARWLR